MLVDRRRSRRLELPVLAHRQPRQDRFDAELDKLETSPNGVFDLSLSQLHLERGV